MAEIRKVEIDGTSYDIVGQGMPSGGATGKVLKKKSGTDYDTEWADEEAGENPLPSGGTTGQSLVKSSNSDYDVEWADVETDTLFVARHYISPATGTDTTYAELYAAYLAGKQLVLEVHDGSHLTHLYPSYSFYKSNEQFIADSFSFYTNDWYYATQFYSISSADDSWSVVSDLRGEVHSIPAGGTSGQVLKKINNTDYNVEWATEVGKIPVGGAAGQVLKKATGDNYDVFWSDEGEAGDIGFRMDNNGILSVGSL